MKQHKDPLPAIFKTSVFQSEEFKQFYIDFHVRLDEYSETIPEEIVRTVNCLVHSYELMLIYFINM